MIVGDHDITNDKDTNSVVKHDVRQIIIHPQYDKAQKNDLALIRLVKPIQYNENVGPVCLPWSLLDLDLIGKTVILAGWGTTEFGGPVSKKLRKVNVVVKSCADNSAVIDKQKMLCTYGVDKDSCQVRLSIWNTYKNSVWDTFLCFFSMIPEAVCIIKTRSTIAFTVSRLYMVETDVQASQELIPESCPS